MPFAILIAIAWLYVVLMAAMAEITSPKGTWLGGVVTFVFYGVVPLSVVLYLITTPARRKRRQEAASIDPSPDASERSTERSSESSAD